MALPVSGGEIVNLASIFEGAKSFIQAYGLQTLALLPLAHVSFLSQINNKFKGTAYQGMLEEVVRDKSKLPPGAIVINEFKDGEFLGAAHMTKNENVDWVAAVHTDEVTGYESSIGYMPYKGILVAGTSNLNKEQAAKIAKKLFKGK